MKRYIIILLTMGTILFQGCEKLKIGDAFLEKSPGVDVTKDTIFKNIEYAQRFLWGGYMTLRYGLNIYVNNTYPESTLADAKNQIMTDLLEDITDLSQSSLTWGGAWGNYYSGKYTAATENSGATTKFNLTLEGTWTGIRMAYIFIQNIDRVPDVDPAYKAQLKAEARMIIACHYADMYRNFGGVPWVGKAYSVSDNIEQLSRLTAQATCDSIVALCDKATVDLPWTEINIGEWDGRFTKASAMGLKARVLLFNASPLFNASAPYLDGAASQQKLTWHGGYDINLWKKAMDAAHDLITQAEATGDYKIYHKAGNTLRKDFQEAYYTRGNGEVLISTRKEYKSNSNSIFYRSSFSWGSGCPTQEYVDMFPMVSGKAITDPTSGYNPAFPYFSSVGAAVRDPRLYETVLVNGDVYRGRTAELWITGRERTTQSGTEAATGYILRKFELDADNLTAIGSVTQWPYLRLAEIYLSYAEASNEFNNGPDAEAYRCVNIIRNRVGLANLPAGLSAQQFRDAVFLERTLEFGWEEVHWYDLARLKREDIFKKPLHGMNITRSASAPYTYTYQLFPCSYIRYWATNWSTKWYLSAFPQNEVNKGYGLIQNPGWE